MSVESRIIAALEREDSYEGFLLVIADCSRGHFYKVMQRLAAGGVVCRHPDNPLTWRLAR